MVSKKPTGRIKAIDREKAVVGVLGRAKDKVMFLLRSLFRGEVDEDCRVRIASVIGQLDEVVHTPRESDNESQAFSST